MKKIALTQGKFTIVDDADFEWLNKWKWQYDGRYATRTTGYRHKKKVYLHKEILKTDMIADHINRNKLDNQRSNLRAVTTRDNILNTGIRSDNTSGYKGLIWCKDGRWKAEVHVLGKRISRYSTNKDIAIEKLKYLRSKYYGVLA